MSNMMAEKVGLVTRGWIDSYDPNTNTLFVKLNNSPVTSRNPAHSVAAPHSLFYNNGLFIGSKPVPGTPVAIAQGSGGQYHYVSAIIENLPKMPDLEDGTLLIRATDLTKLSVSTDNNIRFGSDADHIRINTELGYFSHNFDSQNSFTQASRHVIGSVKRDITLNPNFDQNSKLENDDYDPYYTVIGLDPSSTATNILSGPSKNPPFVEDREMVYEFQYDSDITDDLNESSFYGPKGSANIVPSPTINRRTSRADTLSLTLAAPNYLMETVKGTVVDIFGNILDLNRNPIPIGQDQNTINANKSKDTVKSFLSIKELERKSVAYHFEINARKDLTGQNGQAALPNVNSNADYARNRSRFFFDVDKEGQLKLNVPASSEVGNIPLLARYENYSTFSPDDNGNPNQLTAIKDGKDIFLDSFAAPIATPSADIGFSFATARGSIKIVDGSSAAATPLDRITSDSIGTPTHIMHGTAYHDILQTCYVNQNNSFIDFGYGGSVVPVDLSVIEQLKNVASDTIITSGPKANSGGRSGSLNFDGSLELNVGANTIDRQSLWIDTAGGVVGNFGRDLNGRSAILGMNGDVYLQIGGWGVTSDSRFQNSNNQHRGGNLDIRVIDDNGKASIVSIDSSGNITIMSHGNMQLFAGQSMTISANQNITIDCETLTMQERMVLKVFGGSI